MTESTSLKVFKCPACGGPLEPKVDSSVIKCPYCGASVAVPENLRPSDPLTEYTSLSDVTRLAKAGRLDDAAKVYSKITGLKHEYAMESVKSMAGVYEVGNSAPQSQPRPVSPPIAPSTPLPSPGSYSLPEPVATRRNTSCLSTIIRLSIFLCILGIALPVAGSVFKFSLPAEIPFVSELFPTPFAKEVMSFNAGSFKDPRAIGLDGNGNILVYNYSGDEVLIFDPEGKAISNFEVSDDGFRIFASEMAVASDGTIYIPTINKILVLNENGELLREINADVSTFDSLSVSKDGVLYLATDEGIARVTENGELNIVVTKENIIGYSRGDSASGIVAVDPQGNIYFCSSTKQVILKFSPSGEYISKFGTLSTGTPKPGEFTSVRQIAFDSYGRIYVVDFFEIEVFDADFNYLNTIDGQFLDAVFDAQDNLYGVKNLSNNIEKYEIQKPTP